RRQWSGGETGDPGDRCEAIWPMASAARDRTDDSLRTLMAQAGRLGPSLSPIMNAMLQPDFKEFSRLAREATLIPVVKSVSADLLTPVSAFLAIAQKESHAFLLESIERGEQIGRYTFLGAAPCMRVGASKGKVQIERGRKRESVEDNVFQVVKRLLREHRPATVPGLPPFTAGAVGYFAYDVVRQLEKIGERAKDDLLLPDAELMFFDRLLAFD